jgi:hypothetical protein
MDIPLVNTAPASAPRTVAPVSAPTVAATAQAQTVAALLAQTTVDLSPMGRFLSAIALFQKRLIELQASQAAAQAASEQDVAALVSSAVALAESANTLQTSAITETSDDQSLATLFGQQFDAQTGIPGDSDSLAAIGLSFTDDGVLDVDTDVLRAALADDPAAATDLLTRAGAAFAALAGINPGAGADISALLDDEASVFDLPGQSAPAPFEELPQFADPAPAPGSDDAFLQELLAETPRPALALDQAPPPAFSEAAATFAAQRAADTPLSANQTEAAAPNLAAPATQELPASPAAVAAGAQPDIPRTSAVAGQPAAPAGAAQPAQVQAQAAPSPAGPTRAALDATRDANLRFADTIAAERDANVRIVGARTAQAATPPAQDDDAQTLEKAALVRATEQASERQRLGANVEQTRLDRARDARQLTALQLDDAAPLRERLAAAVPQSAPASDVAPQPGVPQPQPQQQAFNNTLQLARDPSIAAAIAAYNLNTGPFAALNGRPELAAIRPKVVPAVDNVTKVAAIETDAATGESTRPFR